MDFCWHLSIFTNPFFGWSTCVSWVFVEFPGDGLLGLLLLATAHHLQRPPRAGPLGKSMGNLWGICIYIYMSFVDPEIWKRKNICFSNLWKIGEFVLVFFVHIPEWTNFLIWHVCWIPSSLSYHQPSAGSQLPRLPESDSDDSATIWPWSQIILPSHRQNNDSSLLSSQWLLKWPFIGGE